MRGTARVSVLAAWVVALVAVAVTSSAHALGLSLGEYRLDGTALTGALTFARTELVLAVPELEQGDALLSDAVLAAHKDAIRRIVVDRIHVNSGGVACPGTLETAALTGTDAVVLSTRFSCASVPRSLDIDFGAVEILPRGHRHLAHAVLGGTSADWVASSGSTEKHLLVGPGDAEAAQKKPALPLFRMGIEHILTGYDHLMFLAGLVLVSVRVKPLLGAVTAFTVAHSLTLALAALGVWAPSPRIIEPGIALSIAYVGVENIFLANAAGRWRITFPFGLLHGFGFASALREVAMSKSELPLALLSFNLGVETGQLAVLSVLFPLLLLARHRGVLTHRGVQVASGVVAAAGAVWFVARVANL
jgi:hypothetical protein